MFDYKKGENMLLIKEWEKERDTLQHLSQILGKYKLSSRFKEPQWAHVILNITTTGFSTGILFYKDGTYEISVNLRDHRIEVVMENETVYIPLEDGKTIQYYDAEIEKTLRNNGIVIAINKKPQETVDKTPFDEDTKHHHYNKQVVEQVLKIMHFVVKVESRFLSGYRIRKVQPGLFWGTFDISCLINYNEMHQSFDEDKVIEANAFDEHFIEFGFWFGDDRFKGMTFFILPHPFVDGNFSYSTGLPEGAFFDKQLGELMLEVDDLSDETANKVVEFLRGGYKIFKDYLNWEEVGHCFIPLKIKDNALERECNF